MGAPSRNDPDREAAPKAEVPIDEGWSAPARAHNDQTTAGQYIDPASVGRMTASEDRVAVSADGDEMRLGLDVEGILPRRNPDPTKISPRGLSTIGLGSDFNIELMRGPT